MNEAPKRTSAPLLRPLAKAQAVAAVTSAASTLAPETPTAEPRPPKAPPPRKAACAAECQRLEQLPNVGPTIAADLRDLGVALPQDLAQCCPLQLYRQLGELRGKRQDPCMLDTFMAAVDFMAGAPQRPWWTYTQERKAKFGTV